MNQNAKDSWPNLKSQDVPCRFPSSSICEQVKDQLQKQSSISHQKDQNSMHNSMGGIHLTMNLNLPANTINCIGNGDRDDTEGLRQIVSSNRSFSANNDFNSNDVNVLINADSNELNDLNLKTQLSLRTDGFNDVIHAQQSKLRDTICQPETANLSFSAGDDGFLRAKLARQHAKVSSFCDTNSELANAEFRDEKHALRGKQCDPSHHPNPANFIFSVGDVIARQKAKASSINANNSKLSTNAFHISEIKNPELTKSEGKRANFKDMSSPDLAGNSNNISSELNNIRIQIKATKDSKLNKSSDNENENKNKAGFDKDIYEQIQRGQLVRERADCRRI